MKKNQKSILQKLKIEQLNEMQEEAKLAIHAHDEVVLLSPTGTGKTLAFLLPTISTLDKDCKEVQVLILTPSRELAIQIEQVMREMGTGYKVNAVYGGRPFSKDKLELKHRPAILVGTPGRVSDHLRRGTFEISDLRTLILDEFDKSLEVGFEEQMTDIIENLPLLKKKILTSATEGVRIPKFVGINKPLYIDFLEDGASKLQLKTINSPIKDKLETLVKTISHIGNEPTIVFCNFKDTIQRVSDFLTENNITHGCFYGGMEQKDRERALIKFRNGTHQLLLATDLAARGIDVPEIKYIIHYHLPHRIEEFTHRNGRTARMHKSGTAYVLKWVEDALPDFIDELETETLIERKAPNPSEWRTLFISGGRKDKISKGDIAGLFFKKGELTKEDFGVIELKQDCAFVGVKKNKIEDLIKKFNNTRIKKRKVRVTEV